MADDERKAMASRSTHFPEKQGYGRICAPHRLSKRRQPCSQAQLKKLAGSGLIIIQYADHVTYSRSMALAMKPQIREAVGWLVYECEEYVTIAWDRDVGPPTLNGNGKASGLVLRKVDVLEMKKLG